MESSNTGTVPTPGRDQFQAMDLRVPTFGEKAVGLSFNPSGDPTVQKLKELYAQIIDLVDDIRASKISNGEVCGELYRLTSIAITEAQTSQMWAVKAATWKD